MSLYFWRFPARKSTLSYYLPIAMHRLDWAKSMFVVAVKLLSAFHLSSQPIWIWLSCKHSMYMLNTYYVLVESGHAWMANMRYGKAKVLLPLWSVDSIHIYYMRLSNKSLTWTFKGSFFSFIFICDSIICDNLLFSCGD